MFNSVRTRLTAWYVGMLALVLLAFSVGVYALLTRNLNERLDHGLRATLTLTADSLKQDLTEDLAQVEGMAALKGIAKATAERLIEQETALGSIEDLKFPNQAIAIFDGQGRLLAEEPTSDHIHAILPSVHPMVRESIRLFTMGEADDELRVGAKRLQTTSKSYLIVVAQSLQDNAEELKALRRTFYIAVPMALLLAGFCGFLLADQALRPVRAMADQARRISAENLEARLPVANPHDELGQLAAIFNALLTRLNASFDQQRQFMADASHELRTPLSVMHTAAEVILEQPQRTESEYRDALVMIDAQTRRLTRIVKDMLTLARADAGRHPLQQSTFYLDELIGETVGAARVLAARKAIAIEVVVATETPFRADEDLLRQMLLNLLDNAIKYTPAGGTICVSLVQNASTYDISVADSGPGIPLEAQPHIFERFYRVDKARSRTGANGGSGAGLGLAISRWIVQAHHGQLELRRSDENGSLFVASLPINSSPMR